MSGYTAYTRAAALRASVGGPALALPSAPLGTTWLALLDAEPADDGLGANLPELSYPGYARTAIPYANNWVLDPSACLLSNANPIALPTMTGGGPATVLAWALCDAAGSGDVLSVGGLVPIIITLADPSPVIPAGYLILNLAAGA